MDVEAIEAPSITLLGMGGDVTICWDDENREKVKRLVEEKMAQGFSFFIVKPAGSRGKPPKLQDTEQMGSVQTRTLKVSKKVDGQPLSDEALVKALTDGVITIDRSAAPSKSTMSRVPATRATTAAEVVESKTVAVRPIQGG